MAPTWTSDDPWPASICAAIDSAWLIGMAKPWVPDGGDEVNENPVEAAVSMPITWPAVLTSEPPESPDWTSALTSISPESCSLLPSRESLAVIAWSSAVIEPPALEGMPPVPPALPTATTGYPAFVVAESPSAAVRRPDAPCSCRTAMSWVES